MKVCALLSDTRKEEFKKILDALDYEVFYLMCEEKASAAILEMKPTCLFVDEMLDELNALEFCKQIRDMAPSVELPIFMLASENSTIEDVDVLRFGIDGVIYNTTQIEEFKETVNEKLELKNAVKKNEFVRNWVEFEIDNDMRYVKEVHALVEKLFARSKLTPSQIFKLEYSFKEMLQNAWEHGNRKDINKKIRISYVLFDDRLIIKITDEGSGFVADNVENPLEDPIGVMQRRQEEGKRAGGWGIASVRQLMDELIFSDKGNVVLMMKYLNKDKSEE